jgi:hypothetical protein
MWGFAWMFWIVPLLLFMMIMRQRRWERWAMVRGSARPWHGPDLDENDRAHIEALETRISQLEERLDFTERLVSGRRSD